jgi:large subunit ribosomal protein L31
MKDKIHPKYELQEIHCSCGNVFNTKTTARNVEVEICSACHPFYTGTQKLVDTTGRVERFKKRYGISK